MASTSVAQFERDLRAATAALEPKALSKQLAEFARSELKTAIASGAASPSYETIVNGRSGASESSVVAPGPIIYAFSSWPAVIRFALRAIEQRAPRREGRYIASAIVMVNGSVAGNYESI